jgi:hypothetical protein
MLAGLNGAAADSPKKPRRLRMPLGWKKPMA